MIHYSRGEFREGPVPMDPTAPAFRFGAGFFETIYYNGKKLCHLIAHLDRILSALRAYELEYETIDFEKVINNVLERNKLVGKTARVNIFYPVGNEGAHPVVLAVPHEPKPYKAYRLCLCNDRHMSMLTEHKSMNYMFFYLAMQRARKKGFDDAALLDFNDHLLESTTGAILLRKGDDFIKMASPYKLPSTALAVAEQVLDVSPEEVVLNDLPSYQNAYLLNSVIGIRPIVTIGETAFVPDEDICRKVSGAIIG